MTQLLILLTQLFTINHQVIFQFLNVGMFAKTLNSAVLDLIQIPCGQSANSPCVRTLWYSCGDKAFGWSQAFELQKQDATVLASPGPQIAVVGDMGVPHGLSTIAAIAKRMTSHNAVDAGVQLLLHAGDISYADHYERKTDNNSWVWEDYMESLQLVAARVPYMTSPGNHEVGACACGGSRSYSHLSAG